MTPQLPSSAFLKSQRIIHPGLAPDTSDPIAALDKQKPRYWEFVRDFSANEEDSACLEFSAGNTAHV